MGLGINEDEKPPVVTPEGIKVLIENDKQEARVEEAKYVSNPNGDAKIDVEVTQAFSGLTKEELMKYSTDPFWVRLRWFLFILFWVGWLVMLVLAIVIIVQTPGCKPPPIALWVEEQTAVQVGPGVLPATEDLVQKAESMGVESIYLPDLISTSNFDDAKYDVEPLIGGLANAMLQVVTDLPSRMDPGNPLYQNASAENLIFSDGLWNFNHEALPGFINEEILKPWSEKGVTGFLFDAGGNSAKLKFKEDVNNLAKDEGSSIALASDVVDTANEFTTPSAFKAFLEDQSDMMKFYQFNPNYATGSVIEREEMRLLGMGLFLIPGTVILNDYLMDNNTAVLIKELSAMKKLDAIQFGNTNFANTTENVVAFTRIYKGTPAYAVALNFDNSEEVVSFEGTDNIGSVGTTQIISNRTSNNFDAREKYDLNKITLGPYQGVVIQFVAKF